LQGVVAGYLQVLSADNTIVTSHELVFGRHTVVDTYDCGGVVVAENVFSGGGKLHLNAPCNTDSLVLRVPKLS
jgi:hypothetical protein